MTIMDMPTESTTESTQPHSQPKTEEDLKIDCRGIGLYWDIGKITAVDLLRKMVNRIITDDSKQSKKNVNSVNYRKNKPDWWPANTPFASGGARKGLGFKKNTRVLNVENLKHIVQAFQEYCKQCIQDGYSAYHVCTDEEPIAMNLRSRAYCTSADASVGVDGVATEAETLQQHTRKSNIDENIFMNDTDGHVSNGTDSELHVGPMSEMSQKEDLHYPETDSELSNDEYTTDEYSHIYHVHDSRIGCCNILQGLNNLRLSRFLCDIELRCQGARFPVHKCVLAAASPLFYDLFKSYSGVTEYDIAGMQAEDFVQLMDFLYTGQLQLTKDNVSLWKHIANNLQLASLKNAIKGYRLNVKRGKQRVKAGADAAEKSVSVPHNKQSSSRNNDTKWVIRVSSNTTAFHNYCQVSADSACIQLEQDVQMPQDVQTSGEVRQEEDMDMDSESKEDSNEPDLQQNPSVGFDSTGSIFATSITEVSSNDKNTIPGATKTKHHKRSAEGKRRRAAPVTCQYCPDVYVSCNRDRHRMHMLSEHPEKMDTCSQCGYKFTAQYLLDRHEDHCKIRATKDESDFYHCIHVGCSVKSKKLSKTTWHYRRNHTARYAFHTVCDFDGNCSEEFTNKTHFFDHLLKDHDVPSDYSSITLKVHQCTECSYRTVVRNKLQSHFTREHCERLICTICGATLMDETTLKKHIESVHENKKVYRFECVECDKKFTTRDQYDGHNYIRHQVVTTRKQIIHACSVCSYSTVKAHKLTLHYYQVHLDQRDLACSYCGKLYKNKRLLKFHELKHQNMTPYKCDQCDYATHNNNCLKSHMRYIHSENKPYMCDYCGFKTKGMGNLTTHKKRCRRKFEANEPADVISHMATKRQLQQERRFKKLNMREETEATSNLDTLSVQNLQQLQFTDLYGAALQLEQVKSDDGNTVQCVPVHDMVHDVVDEACSQEHVDDVDVACTISEVITDEQIHWPDIDVHSTLELS